MEFRLCYVTCASREEAERIGRALVEARLAACANFFGPATAIYRWQGQIETAQETILILKTRADLVEPLIAAVKERHSYTVPCVIALPIQEGNPDYLAWLAAETAASGVRAEADSTNN